MKPWPASQLFVRRCCIAPKLERQLPYSAFAASVCVCYCKRHSMVVGCACATRSCHHTCLKLQPSKGRCIHALLLFAETFFEATSRPFPLS